jgi:hypothetical protein
MVPKQFMLAASFENDGEKPLYSALLAQRASPMLTTQMAV